MAVKINTDAKGRRSDLVMAKDCFFTLFLSAPLRFVRFFAIHKILRD
jgi:hypothetical protein